MKYHQPYGVVDTNADYVNGDPSIGRAGSIPPAEAIGYTQREIVNLITDAGLATPSDTDLHQLAKAVQSGLLNSEDDAGTANAYAVTLSPAPTAYFRYMRIVMLVLNANSGASVINVNALGAKAIVNKDLSPLLPGQLTPGSIVELVYDGTRFQLLGSQVVAGAPIGGSLTANTTFYVNGTTGHDTNYDGTQATVGTGTKGPFKTIQRAVDEVWKYSPSSVYVCTIQVADNTYNEGVTTPKVAGPACTITGNATTPGNVHVIAPASKNTMMVQGPNNLTVKNLKVTCANSNFAGLCAQGSGANLFTENTETGTIATWGFLANGLGSISINGAHKFTASCSFPFACYRNGTINFGFSVPITISTGITVSAFVVAVSGGQIEVSASPNQATFVNPGNVTGPKYSANLNGVINTQGAGTSYFPGSTAGSLANGGQYG